MITQEAHTAYYQLQFPDASIHPQRQGLSKSEYDDALSRSTTSVAEVHMAAGTVSVPQVFEIDVSAWNNPMFYKRKAGGRKLAQLSFGKDIPLSAQSESALQDLGRSEGVVAFDVPSSDPDGLMRIVGGLRDLGHDVSDPKLVGTQTYFVGKTHLVDPPVDRSDGKPVGLTRAFYEIGRENPELYGKRAKVSQQNGTWLYENMDGETAKTVYDFYEKAYYALEDSPLRQGLSPEEFHKMTTDDAKASKLVYSKDGKTETIYIATPDIPGLDWVNSDWYKNKFPEEMGAGSLIWFPGIATNPDSNTFFNSQRIVNLMAALGRFGNYEPTIVFDFCDHNVEIKLHEALSYWLSKTGIAEVEFNPIATQDYYLAQLKS